jgi:alkylhydroperoxidase family enzyme
MPRDVPRDDSDAVREREALIIGWPPRVAPLEHGCYPEGAYRLANNEREAAGMPPRAADETGPLSDHTATLLRHPELYRTQIAYGVQLLCRGVLAPRDRELAILRTGWLCQAPYEWGEHVRLAKHVGLTAEDVERITEGSTAPGWDEHERAILRAVEELHEGAMISDATWEVLARRLDDQQLIELPCVIGHYHSVAFYQNALRMRTRADNPGLAGR